MFITCKKYSTDSGGTQTLKLIIGIFMAQFHITFHWNSTAILSGLQAKYEGGTTQALEKGGALAVAGPALVLLPPHHL